MASRRLRLAGLNCERLQDFLPREMYAKYGGYCEMLQATFNHVTGPEPVEGQEAQLPAGISVQLEDFDVKGGKFPKKYQDFDGVLITGSLSGVYDKDPWVTKLLQEVKGMSEENTRVCGISFGHQAVAQALGGHVAQNPKGSEVSVRPSTFTPEGKKYFGTSMDSFHLLYHHNDAILRLPPGFSSTSGNNVTHYQGLFKGDQFLTFCGHPDYSHAPEVLAALLELDRQQLWVPEQLIELGLPSLHKPTDYEWVTRHIIRFFAGIK